MVTNTATVRVNYYYRCSKCGAIIGQSAFISKSSSYARYSDMETRKNTASSALFSAQRAAQRAVEEAKKGNYLPMHIRRKCPKCKHREPWQKMKVSGLLLVTPVTIFIGVVFLWNGLNYKNTKMAIMGGVLLLPSLGLIIGGIIKRRRMNALSALLPQASRPHFFFPDDQEMADAALLDCNFKPGEEIIQDYPDFPRKFGMDESNTQSGLFPDDDYDGAFCDICGRRKKELNDVVFKTKHGEKKKKICDSCMAENADKIV